MKFWHDFLTMRKLLSAQMLECPTGIQSEKEQVVALVVTFQRTIIVDFGLAIIGIYKVCSKVQPLTPLILRTDRVAKLSVHRHIRGPIFAVHRARIIGKAGHQEPGFRRPVMDTPCQFIRILPVPWNGRVDSGSSGKGNIFKFAPIFPIRCRQNSELVIKLNGRNSPRPSVERGFPQWSLR